MSWSMRRTLTLGLSLAIGVLAINALVTFWNIRTLISSGQWVIHTREVLNELDELFATVQDVEAAHRGFLLTGDESYLKRAEPAATSLAARIDHLRAITADNSRQQTRLPLLERQIGSRLDMLLADDTLRREHGLDAAIRSLADGRGQQASTELRNTLETVKHEEESLLTRRTRDAESSVWWTVGSFSLASLLAIGLLGTTCYSIWKEASVRQRSAQTIRRYEAREAAILESSLDAVIAMDHRGRVIEFNPAAERIFGYSRASTLGVEMAELIIPPGLRDAHRRGMERLLETGEGPVLGRRVELTAQRSGGSEFPVELAVTRLPVDGPPMFTAFIRDITAKKQEERAAEEREHLSALAMDVGNALIQGDDLPEILRRCCEAMVHHLDGAFARIWTLDDRENMLVLQASAGMYTHKDGPHGRVPVGQFKIGLIAQERRPHLTNDILGDPRVGDQEWACREGMVAFAGYPLMIADRVVGVLAIFARHPLTDAGARGDVHDRQRRVPGNRAEAIRG